MSTPMLEGRWRERLVRIHCAHSGFVKTGGWVHRSCPGLAVTAGRNTPGFWVITHLASGYKIPLASWNDYADAKDAARLLSQIADWRQDEGVLIKIRGLMDAARAIYYATGAKGFPTPAKALLENSHE